ncbi:hypothetical protein ED733_004308 [Metarhizium rileyi]|uniref:Uncharacterized protein n=1 Tax=Metarhizium rileyi (strain RCEF 4871) TaxID=1649241 RepID=A0A5C6G5C9_METRR|nr:hypothetical protein ED733_004308 [Metarhizium rileyi]
MAKDKDVWMYNPSVALAIIGTVVAIRPHFHSHHLLDVLPVQRMPILPKTEPYWWYICVPTTLINLGCHPNRAAFTGLVRFDFKFHCPGTHFYRRGKLHPHQPSDPRRSAPRRIIAFLAFLGNDLHRSLSSAISSRSSSRGNGSAIASSEYWQGEKEKIGRYVLIGGLVFQLVAFGLFLCVSRRFHVSANSMARPDAPRGWQRVVLSVFVPGVLIMVRCIYRVCEFAEGTNGYAFRTEWLFWVLETLPMTDAIGIFIIYHPSRFLGENGAAQPKEARSDEPVRLGGKPRWFRTRRSNDSPA